MNRPGAHFIAPNHPHACRTLSNAFYKPKGFVVGLGAKFGAYKAGKSIEVV